MLSKIVKNTYDNTKRSNSRNGISLLGDKEEVLYIKELLDGSKEYIFSLDTVRIFDSMVLNLDKKLFSTEQYALMTSYLMEETSEINTALDKYLAGFTEVTCTPEVLCIEYGGCDGQ